MDLRSAFPAQSAYGDAPVMVNCFAPKHQDDTASLAIYADHLHCYGCGWHLGPRRAAEAIAAHCHLEVSTLLDAQYVPRPHKAVKDLRAEPMSFDELIDAYERLHHGDRMHALNWLGARGLSSDAIDVANLGHDGRRFVIPVQARNHCLLTLRYRVDPFWQDDDYDGPKYMGYRGRNGLLLYGEHWVNPNTEWLVLCEGELDALRLWQETFTPPSGPAERQDAGELSGPSEAQPKAKYGKIAELLFAPDHYPAVSATNGASQMERLTTLIRDLFPKVTHVVVASDQDRAGQQAARDTALALQQAGLTWERAFWDMGKDVTEYLQSGGTPELFLPHPERRNNMADIILRLAHAVAR